MTPEQTEETKGAQTVGVASPATSASCAPPPDMGIPLPEVHLQNEITRLNGLLNSPELHDFSKAVVLEAAHQRERFGSGQDAGKEPSDWFWLLGYLSGKALKAATTGDHDKALHHCISSAAVLANWHAALTGADNFMRPGIAEEKQPDVGGGHCTPSTTDLCRAPGLDQTGDPL